MAQHGVAGQTAIVTGAGSGFGRETCILLASYGAAAVMCFDIDGDAASATVNAVHAVNPTCCAISFQGDVGNEDSVKAAVDTAVSKFGRVDIMIANAGITGNFTPFLEEDGESWDRVLRINTIGVFFCIKYAALAMKNQSQRAGATDLGSIVCTASVAGIASGAGPTSYSASKAAVINLVKTSSIQLGFAGPGKNIRVNAVCPGLVETGMTRFVYDIARQRGKEGAIGAITPAQRSGSAREVAEVMVFLASDRASLITGQALAVDGGLSASLPVVRPGAKL